MLNWHVGVGSIVCIIVQLAFLENIEAAVARSSWSTNAFLQNHHEKEIIDDSLRKLRAALLASDGAEILQITDELRRPFLGGAEEALMITSSSITTGQIAPHPGSWNLSSNRSNANSSQVNVESNGIEKTLSFNGSVAKGSHLEVDGKQPEKTFGFNSSVTEDSRMTIEDFRRLSKTLSSKSSVTKDTRVKFESNQTQKTLNFNSSLTEGSQVKVRSNQTEKTMSFNSSDAKGSRVKDYFNQTEEILRVKREMNKQIKSTENIDSRNAASRGKTMKQSVANSDSNVCVFDDTLFSLTKYAKQELAAELKRPGMQKALGFVRRGGWWSCAAEGQSCMCVGEARFVDIDRQPLPGSSIVNTESFGGIVPCNGKNFALSNRVQPVWPSADVANCECRSLKSGDDKTDGDGFHLENRLSSESRLQEAWVFLFRLLSKTKQLPLGTGDRTFQGIENWGARADDVTGRFYQTVPERFWITKYVREVAGPAISGPKCLEWGNPEKPGKEFVYASLVAQCTEKYDMQFDYIYWRGSEKHVSGNVVHSDILSLPDVLGDLRMDAIFATQVFEHLAEPFPAAEALFNALAPGGVLIFTVPQMAQFHKVPHDYYRYTIEGSKYLLVRAGFCVPNSAFAGGGDFIFDAGRDAGLQIQDYSMDEVDAAFQLGYDKVSHGAITIHALAFKPPHSSCMDPTAGWDELARQGIRA